MKNTTWLKIVLPILVLALGALGAGWMVMARPAPGKVEREVPAPLVRAAHVELTRIALTVTSQGTVRPRTESALVSEVAGRVIWVADEFAAGGFFNRDEPLLRIDTTDYRQAVTRAEATVARAELALAREQAEAAVARREWNQLGGDEPSPLTLREPQLAEARASIEAARADLERARRDLDRTEIRAPYDGRVRTKQADVGQYLAPGSPAATIYAVDAVEIRLPLPDDELAYLDLPLAYSDRRSGRGPAVTLRARVAGEDHQWRGRIVRTEGEIDPTTRMIHAVARVDAPYARGDEPDRPPLSVGLFVEAEIAGRTVENVARLPRVALRADGTMLVIDDENRLRFRAVELLRLGGEDVLVSAGLQPNERVCVSALEVVTDGMRVRVADSARKDGAS